MVVAVLYGAGGGTGGVVTEGSPPPEGEKSQEPTFGYKFGQLGISFGYKFGYKFWAVGCPKKKVQKGEQTPSMGYQFHPTPGGGGVMPGSSQLIPNSWNLQQTTKKRTKVWYSLPNPQRLVINLS